MNIKDFDGAISELKGLISRIQNNELIGEKILEEIRGVFIKHNITTYNYVNENLDYKELLITIIKMIIKELEQTRAQEMNKQKRKNMHKPGHHEPPGW
jgi:hypothetical protein